MKNNGVRWMLGAVGAFCTGWLAVHTLLPSAWNPDGTQRSVRIATGIPLDVPINGLAGSAEPLQGAALKAAVAEILKLKVPSGVRDGDYITALFEFAERVSSTDFPAVLNALHASGKMEHESMRAQLLAYWVERDLNTAWRYFVAMPPRDRDRLLARSNSGYDPVLDSLARVDGERLLSWLGGLPSEEAGALRTRVRSAISEVYGERDPARGISLLFDGPEGTKSGIGPGEWNLFSKWAEQDPEAAAVKLLSSPASNARWAALMTACETWEKRDPQGLRTWVQQIADADLARQAALAVAWSMANNRPEEALKFAVERGITGDALFPEMVEKRWIYRDTTGALRWMQSLPPGPVRASLLTQALRMLAIDDPKRTVQLYREESGQLSDTVEAAGAVLPALVATGDMRSAVSILASMTPEEQLGAVTDNGYRLWEQLDPLLLLRSGLEIPAGPTRDRWMDNAIEKIAGRWGIKTLEQYLVQLPTGVDRSRAGATAMELAFSGTTSQHVGNPESALRIAKALDVSRDALLQGVNRWLGGVDRTSALQWVQQTPELTEIERQSLLAAVPNVVTAPRARTGGGVSPATQNQIPRP